MLRTGLVIYCAVLLGCESGDQPQGAALPAGESIEPSRKISQPHSEITNSIGMAFKLLPLGTFLMGEGSEAHQVTFTKLLPIGVYEVTQGQYERVMGTNPSTFKGLQNPVEHVSWEDAVEFCERLSELPEEKEAGRIYRLPTEAEWEYACRAGTSTKFCFGDNYSKLGDYAWFGKNSGGKTHPVGKNKPNAWGLYDMHGNVWEWCSDWYGDYPKWDVTDPLGLTTGSGRVFRGGCWGNEAADCRSANRYRIPPENRNLNIGIRVAMGVSGPTQPNLPSPASTAQDSTNQRDEGLGLPLPGEVSLGQNSREELINSIGMKLVLIPKGTFKMGSPENEPERSRSEFLHEVTISSDFYLGVYEVTQAQYMTVIGSNPSHFQGDKIKDYGRNHPVEQVSWEDAVEFCRKLSEFPEEQKLGRVYRLPTEAQWEYACRAGTTTRYSFGDNYLMLSDYAWFEKNSDFQTHAVGKKKPNAWGLHDMHGNVQEWCSNWKGNYQKWAVTDPVGPEEGFFRIHRGGSWTLSSSFFRSAETSGSKPSARTSSTGFRVALISFLIPE